MVQRNGKYLMFSQSNFTVGDISQFRSILHFRGSVGKDLEGLSKSSVLNTFSYIFEKFKKGIFVRINENKVESFIPFENVEYQNE